ncbi:dihydrofolate reductase [Ammoniphilus sp. CFH 90114]|uniref:dihydrofolate reductase n=1 Tax=Ammoniphilus sp. CFH 90114 TaxID=2493665 RepID=UPI00100EA886|nr:dihydrofolate reductase [Ammoniphilus sp. CFH 90114]RXT05728.1 dihydrofolate reductase [Ammoniphilus sp. CFH 90114]
MISVIVAMSRNRVIGKDNKMPWHLPADLAYFKRVTMGHTVLMGRKTFESMGKPLPGRNNVILTRQKDYHQEGCRVLHTIEEALREFKDQDLFVIGGAEIIKEFLPVVDKLYLTQIDEEFEGDTFLPEFDAGEWVEVSRTEGVIDEKNKFPHTFFVYEKK